MAVSATLSARHAHLYIYLGCGKVVASDQAFTLGACDATIIRMNNPGFRPPVEANSLILQVDQGCPYNRCTFCGMYRDVPYERRTIDQIRSMIERECDRSAVRIFLADGDVMRRSSADLTAILELINESFPRLRRVNAYATGSGMLDKTVDKLASFKRLKLHTLYMGLESGDEQTLRESGKGETAQQMVEVVVRAQSAGLQMSIMVLLGLAGQDRSADHAKDSALVVNQMQPRLLSCLRAVPVSGTELFDDVRAGRFKQVSERGAIEELRLFVEGLNLDHTIFRANHSSNVVPLEARFPRDKDRLLAELDSLLASDVLDELSPGPMPMWL